MYTVIITFFLALVATLFNLWLRSKNGKKWIASL